MSHVSGTVVLWAKDIMRLLEPMPGLGAAADGLIVF